MPKVLVISRYFPPLGSAGGSIRLVKLMKYANRQGWSFIVFTQDLHRTVISESGNCNFLMDEVPISVKVKRVTNPVFHLQKTFFHLLTGDSSIPWGLNVILHTLKPIKKIKPDLIFVNSPPFTNVGIGLALSILCKLPLVVDLKDDWVGSVAFQHKGRLRKWLEMFFEKTVFKRAAAIITVTQSSFDSCKGRYADESIIKKIYLIPNGEDIEETQNIQVNENQKKNGRFRFTSAAAGFRPDYRDLSPFIEALADCLKRNPTFASVVEIAFLGEYPDEQYKRQLSQILTSEQILFLGSLNRPDLMTELKKANCFFLVQPKGNTTAIAGTLYEYRAINQAPVFLFSEAGATSQFVIENEIGVHFYFDQLNEASQWLEKIINAWISGKPILIDTPYKEIFHREKIAKEMTHLWLKAISKKVLLD